MIFGGLSGLKAEAPMAHEGSRFRAQGSGFREAYASRVVYRVLPSASVCILVLCQFAPPSEVGAGQVLSPHK